MDTCPVYPKNTAKIIYFRNLRSYCCCRACYCRENDSNNVDLCHIIGCPVLWKLYKRFYCKSWTFEWLWNSERSIPSWQITFIQSVDSIFSLITNVCVFIGPLNSRQFYFYAPSFEIIKHFIGKITFWYSTVEKSELWLRAVLKNIFSSRHDNLPLPNPFFSKQLNNNDL